MHRLTKTGKNRIRVDLEDTEGNTAYADYDMFAVASERAKYQLSLGTYSGETTNQCEIGKNAVCYLKAKYKCDIAIFCRRDISFLLLDCRK